jgi:hypothetical protein
MSDCLCLTRGMLEGKDPVVLALLWFDVQRALITASATWPR